MPFKPDFLWGASTSAYQVEGASAEDGKGPSVQDIKTLPPGTADFTVASDHYHRFREDIALMAEMGLKAYRFSIAWTRIYPQGNGPVNVRGLQHYSEVIDTCLAHGLTPIVTMYHFDLPAALDAAGGWNNRATIDAFVQYARTLFEQFGDRVKYWLTINEQNMMVLCGDAVGTVGNQEEARRTLYQQNHHMLLAQAQAVALCHSLVPDARIGPAPNICSIYPRTCAPEDVLAAQDFEALRNWLYLDAAVYGTYNPTAWNILRRKGVEPTILSADREILKAGKPDFLAFNYYNTITVQAPQNTPDMQTTHDQQTGTTEPGFYEGVVNPYLGRTRFGWEVDPVGFRTTLRAVYERYRLPLLVTENGLGDCDSLDADGTVTDDYRIEYLQAHIAQMQRAVEDGVEIIGYCPWSALDLISTHEGIRKRYGFIYVNRTDEKTLDLRRIPKKSFYWYRDVIRSAGIGKACAQPLRSIQIARG